ncbi:MAG: sarcosine oxidase subunit gamma [Paracoccaceae bacterium]
MDKITLTPASPLGGYSRDIGTNHIVERSHAIVSVATPLGEEPALAEALQANWSLALPSPRQSTTYSETRSVRTAPDQLLLIFPYDTPDANAHVKGKIGDAGYTTDQTDIWVQLEISGPDTLAALERLCPIDLDMIAFPISANARTIFEHMGTIIIRLDQDKFLLLSTSSSAHSFLHAVETSFFYTAVT